MLVKIQKAMVSLKVLGRDERGDAGTNWLIGIAIAVVIGAIVLSLASPTIRA